MSWDPTFLPTAVVGCARAHRALGDRYRNAGDEKSAVQLHRVAEILDQLALEGKWSTLLPEIGDTLAITASTKAWWHGCWDEAVHYLYGSSGRAVMRNDTPAFAQPGTWLDGGWAPRRTSNGDITFAATGATDDDRRKIDYGTSECPQGLFLYHRLLGGRYSMIAFWDRTHGDKRDACNSCYIVEGTASVEDMLAWFPKHFPLQAKHLEEAGVKLSQVQVSG